MRQDQIDNKKETTPLFHDARKPKGLRGRGLWPSQRLNDGAPLRERDLLLPRRNSLSMSIDRDSGAFGFFGVQFLWRAKGGSTV